MSCSRTQRSAPCEARTHDPSHSLMLVQFPVLLLFCVTQMKDILLLFVERNCIIQDKKDFKSVDL